MINTLYLPELRQMLAENDESELREFCAALHPARTAEFMEGLTASESWRVLEYAEPRAREEIFTFFDPEKQVEIFETEDRKAVANLIAGLAADDRVDVLDEVLPEVVSELLPLLPAEDRQEVLRLRSHPDESAGAVMTTEAAMLSETLTVKEALEELSRQAEELETIYYLYIVDEEGRLRGLVSARKLVSSIGKMNVRLKDLMDTDLIVANVLEDQESVANKVAHYDLLAIPVVDRDQRLLGIITHDDIIDVFREEAVEDAHRIAAVEPLEDSYLKTKVVTLVRKRGIWLTILFFASLLTAWALAFYHKELEKVEWLAYFLPLVISVGGNSGSQASTLVITALAVGDISLRDWGKVVLREIVMGLMLGGFLSIIGYVAALFVTGDFVSALIIPITIVLVVMCGTLLGATFPQIFKRFGWDPALMSSPFVAGIVDIVGILIYMNVATCFPSAVTVGG